jgi:hypothetical protein
LDDRYLERLYGINRNRLDYLSNNSIVEEGSAAHYEAMMTYIRANSMEVDAHVDRVETMMDIDNYIDYFIAQSFIGNTDWPGNNIDYWRLQTEYSPNAKQGHDGRWRWIFFDADFGFGLFRESPNKNHFTYLLQPYSVTVTNPLWSTELFRELNKNARFRQRFHDRYLDLLNTTFKTERVMALADSMKSVIQPHIRDHIARWSRPRSYESWENEVDYMMNGYIAVRANFVLTYLRSRYRLGAIAEITVQLPDTSVGSIRLNTLDFNGKTGPWKGTYTQRVQIHLQAEAKPGYTFSHWEGYPDASETLSVFPAHGQTFTRFL